ncbi:outer membrane lipoprotein carrier protein LolA [uncultured Friedmanniella sp.]|uniref:LolA family protein n=1 Tax=uncultured Friedmanniella sp. TaxID=335381 RepID=UPI0035C9D32B
MSIFERRPALRWAAPLALLAVVGGTGVLATTANADPTLPTKSPEQLLVDVANAKVDGLSGTVVQTADLGLPSLPSSGSASTQELTSLLSGTHTLKVWTSGEDKARLEVLDNLAATDVIRNGSDVWTWSSEANAATHRTLPAGDSTDKAPVSPDVPTTPQQAAQQALAAVGDTTDVSVVDGQPVAGRTVYELVLAPKDTRSTLESVRIAVDEKTSVPLEVEAIAKGGTTVFDVAYSSVDFGVPDSTQFDFTPPPGAKVTEGKVTAPKAPSASDKKAAEKKAADAKAATTTVGTGWTSVVVTKLPADATSSSQVTSVLNALPKVSGSWGSGHLFTGKAFSAVVTDDGRIAVGAVEASLLYDALAK